MSALTSFKPANSQQNNNFIEDKIKKYAIKLMDVGNIEFVPFGAENPNNHQGNPYSDVIQIYGQVQRGVYESLSLEVKKDGKYVEVARLNDLFTPNKGFSFKWDGFIDGIYDSAFMTSTRGVDFKIKGFNGGSEVCADEKNFSFRYFKKDWIDVRINKKIHRISVKLRVNLIDGGTIGLLHSGYLVSEEAINKNKTPPYTSQTRSFSQLQQLAIEGINYYWSRNNTHPTGKNILINNNKYEVFVKTKITTSNALPEMKITFATNVDPNHALIRSSNWALSRKTAYITGYL